jgi:hypothetical protein
MDRARSPERLNAPGRTGRNQAQSIDRSRAFPAKGCPGENGGGGIRTHEGFDTLPVFKTGAFNLTRPPLLAVLC